MAIALPTIPLIVKFAEIAGIVVSGVATAAGLDKLSNKVETYIQENPEQSKKIFAMIMPEQGIANILKNKSSEGEEISEEELGEIDVEKKPKLTGKEKGMRIKEAIRRARAGKGNYSSPDATGSAVDIRGSVIREVEDMGIADKNLKDNYDPDKPKYDYKKFYRKRKADGGAIGLDSLLQPERKKFNEGSNWWDTLSDQGMGVYNAMKRGGHDDPTIQNQLSMLGYYDSNSTPNSNPVDNQPNQPNQPSQGIINQNINQYQSGNQGGADDTYTGFGDFGNLDESTAKIEYRDVSDGKGGSTVEKFTTYKDPGGLRRTIDGKFVTHGGHDIEPIAISIANAIMGKEKYKGEYPEAGTTLGTFSNRKGTNDYGVPFSDLSVFQKIKMDRSRNKELKELKNQFDLQAKMKRQIAKEEAAQAEIARQAAFNQARADRASAVSTGLDAAIRRGDDTSSYSRPSTGAYSVGAGMGMGGGYTTDYGFKNGGLASMFKRKR
jgi:hypothetical protein